MQLVLQQVFPLGRFHATPWRTNPFDDAYGEWPPSPWRLVRAVVARWYQWVREAPTPPDSSQLHALVRALCTSRYRFYLPRNSRRGTPLRQYFPVEFGWDPDRKDKPGLRTYSRSLAQDNYWCVDPTETGAVWWFLDGEGWTDELVSVLDRCLERIVYLGRAETFTRISRTQRDPPAPNCDLSEERSADSVPVLVPSQQASLTDVEQTTEDTGTSKRSLPGGSRMMFASRPPRPAPQERPSRLAPQRECRLVQLAIGWSVAPEMRAIVRLTSRFRGAVLRELVSLKTRSKEATWSRADASTRREVAEMSGKDARGKPLVGHQHAEFLVWCEGGIPTRLLVWRDGRPFDQDEQRAIFKAASRELSWAAAGPDSDAWKVRLVPLDRAVPPPPGFDGPPARLWESVTPYVPARHHLRRGKPRDSETIDKQVRRELTLRGFERADEVQVEVGEDSSWMAVHMPRAQSAGRRFLGDRRGYLIRLTFPVPVRGPLRLGHSSSFGLGLFRPL